MFDAIVIGSGMSGGIAAKELCERGLKTLILERGRKLEHGASYTDWMQPWEVPNAGLINEDELARERQPGAGFAAQQGLDGVAHAHASATIVPKKKKAERNPLRLLLLRKVTYCFFSVLPELPEDGLLLEPLDAEPELSLFELSLFGWSDDELPDAAEPDDFSDFAEDADPPLEAEPLMPILDMVCWSSWPVAFRPFCCWYSRRAGMSTPGFFAR